VTRHEAGGVRHERKCCRSFPLCQKGNGHQQSAFRPTHRIGPSLVFSMDFKKSLHALLRVLEFFICVMKSAAFAGEQEISGCFLSPLCQHVRGRELIKGVVDFDRAQVAGIVREKLFPSHACWIKWSDPVRIIPTGSSDRDSADVLHGFSCHKTIFGMPIFKF
jgi:hypothetical protein